MRPPTHSARYDVDVAVVDEELQQLGLPREHSDALSGAIMVGRSEMQRRFRESSLRLPSLDLLQWCASPHVTLESRVLATRRSMRGVIAGGEVEGRQEGKRESGVNDLPQHPSLAGSSLKTSTARMHTRSKSNAARSLTRRSSLHRSSSTSRRRC